MKNKILGIGMIVLGVLIFLLFTYFAGGIELLKQLFAVFGLLGFIGVVAGLIAGGIIKGFIDN